MRMYICIYQLHVHLLQAEDVTQVVLRRASWKTSHLLVVPLILVHIKSKELLLIDVNIIIKDINWIMEKLTDNQH